MFYRCILLFLIFSVYNVSATSKFSIRDFNRHLLKEPVGLPNAIHPIDVDKDGDYDLVPELKGTPFCWWENNKTYEMEEHVIDESLITPMSLQ